MSRRSAMFAISTTLALAATVGPALAGPYDDNVVAQLTSQGFGHIATERTWLGRVRITAERTDGQREIILNPKSGEILRDLWNPTDASSTQTPILDDVTAPAAAASGTSAQTAADSGTGSDTASSGSTGGDTSGSGSSDGGTSGGTESRSGSGSDGGSSGGSDTSSGGGSDTSGGGSGSGDSSGDGSGSDTSEPGN